MLNTHQKLNRLLYIFSWVINLCLILIAFASINKETIEIYFSSDSLYLASLYKDIFVDGTGFKGWHLNAAPNFFPDMFLYFITNTMISDFRIAYIVFSGLQYLLILLLLNLVITSIKPDIKNIFLTLLNLLFPVFLLTTIISGFDLYSYLIFSHSYHSGVFINTLLAIIFLFKYLNKKRTIFIYLAALITLIGIYNDRLFLVLYSAPLVLVLIMNYIWFKNKQIKLIVPIILAASVISLLLYNLTSSNSVFSSIDLGKKYMNHENILPSFIAFIKQHFSYIQDLRIKGIVSIVLIINFFVLLFLIIKRSKIKESILPIYFVFVFASIFITLITPIINGYYMNEATARFNIFSFWLSVFNLTLFLYFFFKNKARFLNLLTTAFFVFYIGLIVFKFSSLPISKNVEYISSYYPEEVKAIDEFAKKHNLKYGLANYWDSKYSTLFSQNELRVYTIINENLNPWFHVMNKNWYFDYHKGKYNKPLFNFIVLNGFNKEKIKENFRQPLDSLIYNNKTILYKMKDIKYKKKNNKAYIVNTNNSIEF